MFDLSWIELAFCVAVAIVVVGPKDLPRLVRLLSGAAGKMRRISADVRNSVTRLEREISRAEQGDPSTSWQQLIPREIRELRNSIEPHATDRNATAKKYALYKEAAARARSAYDAVEPSPENSGQHV